MSLVMDNRARQLAEPEPPLLGIHNEPGFSRLRPTPPLNELLPTLLHYITSTSDSERSFLPFLHDGEDEVVLLVNNLGGVSTLEMGCIAGEAVKALRKEGIKVARMLVGTFMVCYTRFTIEYRMESFDGANVLSLDLSQYARVLLDASPPTPGLFFVGSSVPPR